jgi:proteasome alpha subunit
VTTPVYISPEQIMKDKADYARKGIARGRSVVVLQYDDGILLVAENPSRALHKISEIHDRIAFAAVGKYNEFENLRIAGVRIADLRGYSYDRRDVTGRGLANAYAQTLGAIFSTLGEKPLEVEIVVAEVGDTGEEDQIYRLTYDGSVADEHGFVVMGGQAEQINGYLEQNYTGAGPLADALPLAVRALGETPGGAPRQLTGGQLEVAVLDRTRPKRKFRRITGARLDELLRGGAAPQQPSGQAPGTEQPPSQQPPSQQPPTQPATRGPAEPRPEPPSGPPVGPPPPRPGQAGGGGPSDEDLV